MPAIINEETKKARNDAISKGPGTDHHFATRAKSHLAMTKCEEPTRIRLREPSLSSFSGQNRLYL